MSTYPARPHLNTFTGSSTAPANPAAPSLKGVILVGGPSVGTRFRPLSMDCPKPLFPIAGVPMIHHHVLSLSKTVGMREILLIGFYENSVFDRFIGEASIEFPHISIRYLREYQSLGTGGGVYHFRDEIMRGNPDAFFVLNADIASSFPLNEMLAFHRNKQAIGTVMGINVDKSKAHRYGCLVPDAATSKVVHFVEKPQTFISDLISCGIYLLSRDVFPYFLKAISNRRAEEAEEGLTLDQFANASVYSSNASLSRSNERIQLEQDVLRTLALDGHLYVFTASHRDFWMAVKHGSSAIPANRKYLQYFMQAQPRRLSEPYPELIAPVYIHPTAIVHPSSKIGPNVSIGPRALIGRGVRIRESLVLDAVEIKNDACIINAIVGWDSKIGAWARVEGSTDQEEPSEEAATSKGSKIPTASILGKDVTVGDELIVRDCIVLPHKEIKRSFQQEILM
ncbi:nucleotide-diphospho-sugar transferase [Entophlyctis helioformis]|nr:nucleotide-diphospho-sugar transferase [Entophlyctis helioformis]